VKGAVLTVLMALMVRVAWAQVPRDVRPMPAPAPAGAIAGTVTSDDPQPRPLRRARVTLTGPLLPAPRTVITADDGTFAFAQLPAGSYTVTAAKDGYVPMAFGATRTARPGTSVAVAAASVRVNIRLPRGAVITGVVTDIDGLPAPGIVVSALAQRFVPIPGERRYVATGVSSGPTDDRGMYRIYALPAGDYVIAAQPQNRQASREFSEVRMMAGGAPSNTHLAMAQVFHPASTDLARAARTTVRPGEERTGIDVQLQYVPLAAVSGSLPPGQAATLMMTRVDEVPGFDQVRNARADAEGRFTFSSVPPGQYRIVFRNRGEGVDLVAFADVVVSGEDVDGVALAPQPALTLAGRIVFEGDSPPAALPALPRVPFSAAMTIANVGFVMPALQIDGTRFKIEGIIPGTYRLSPTTQGLRTPIGKWWLKSVLVAGRDILDAPLDLQTSADDAVATFADRASELSGIVTDGQRSPVAGALVVVFATERSAWFMNSRRVVGVRTDRDGRYAIRNLPPGEYRVALAPDLDLNEWYDPSVLQVLLPAGLPLTISGAEKSTVDLSIR